MQVEEIDNDNNIDSKVPIRTSQRKAVNTNEGKPLFQGEWSTNSSNSDDDDGNDKDGNNGDTDNTLAAGISGSPTGNTRRGGQGATLLRVLAEGSSESTAGNTRKGTMAKRAKAQNEQKKRKM